MYLGYSNPDKPVSILVGLTMKSVVNDGNDQLIFTTEDDRKFVFYHSQDCCESVTIEDICGDLEDLVGSPITMAEEEVSSERQPWQETDDTYYPESFTWTFYKFATAKGYVTVRWYGSSNGYYGEGVDFVEVTDGSAG